jgi:hypothetical protein
MAVNIIDLQNKVEDGGQSNNGVLRAEEFNRLVEAVVETQDNLVGIVKGVQFGAGGEVARPNADGVVTIRTDVTDKYKFSYISPDENYDNFLSYIRSFPSYILAGESYNVKVRVSFTERFNDVDTSINEPLKVNFKVGTNTVYSTNIYDYKSEDSLIKDTEKTVSFNFANYLAKNSINECSIEVVDKSEYPRITPQVVKFYKVFVVNASCNIKLEGTVNNLNIYDTSSLSNDASNIVITTTSNSGKVQLFCKEFSTATPVFTIDNITNTTTSIKLNNTNLNSVIRTHGAHTLYAILEYTIPGTTDKLNIVSNELSYIFYDNTIASEDPLVSINKVSSGLVFKEYSQVILSYLIYLPENYVPAETKEGRSIIISTNKLGVATPVISRSYEIVPEQLASNILTGNISYLISNTVDKTIQLESGKYEMVTSFENYSSKMDIEIEMSEINLENYNIIGQQVYFKSADKSPGDTTWSYTFEDKNNNITETYNIKFNNFDFTEYGSSFKTDTSLDGGQTVLNIKRNSSIEIPYSIFAKPLQLESTEGGSNGKTISIEFKTYNCVSQVKPIITCIDMDVEEKDRVGFIVYPNKVIVQSKSGNKFEAKFKEDEHIKLDIVVEGFETEYFNPTVSGTKGEDVAEGEDAKSSEALVIIYVNGVYQRLHRILSKSDTYSEYLKGGSYVTNNCPIVIGSEGCDIDLYSVKLYEKPLSSKEIVFNYAFDTPKFEDRISIISRNDIWTDSVNEISKLYDIDRAKLEKQLPDLPIFSFQMHESNKNVLPVDKKNWKFLTKSTYFNKNIQDGNSETGNISFFVNSSAFRNQGTSSMNYPMPWRNWDWKTDTDVATESGAIKEGDPLLPQLKKKFYKYDGYTELGKVWKQYDNMPNGIRKITFKKDYASSEMCNNAVCSALFTDMAIIAGSSADFKGVLQPTGSLNKYGHRLSLIATPCFMYQELTGENTGKTKTLGMMNLIPNKNETDYLGLGDTDSRKWDLLKILALEEHELYSGESNVPRAQAWEVSENHVIWDTKYESYSVADVLTDKLGTKYPNIKQLNATSSKVTINFDNLFNKDDEALREQTLNEAILTIKNKLNIVNDEELLKYDYYVVKNSKEKDVFIKITDEGDKESEDYVFTPSIELFGTYINSILNNYEARYPKDSSALELGPNEDINVWGAGEEADFGFAPDSDWMFSTTPTTIGSLAFTQTDVIIAETRDIIRFHNWLVDCHPAKCVAGAKIEIERDGVVEEVDDIPANRLAKFKAEAANYLILDQWILYYIWRELFWMFDSGSKNLQIYTIDGIHWGCMVRDADTALGIDNLGVEMFPPYLEDTDFYTDVNGVEFFFDKAADKYSIGQLENDRAKGVMNGQFGSIWLNLRDSYKSEIRSMAQYLLSQSANKLTTNGTIKAFDSHQDKWSESLYNFGMRQYFGGELFYKWISSGNGNKRLSRKDWLTKAFDYRLGKYKCYSNDGYYHINWRATKLNVTGVQTNNEFELKFYQPCYILSGGSTSGIENTSPNCYKRITAFGDEINNIPIAGWGFPGDGTAEANTYFYGAHNITDFGPLYKTIELADFNPNNALTKITKLEFGNKEWSKTNNVHYGLAKPLILNSMNKLQYLDITNHHALKEFFIVGCTQLEKLYMSGTDALTEVVLPKTKTLNTVHFGKSIRILDLSDLVGITNVNFDSYSSIVEFNAKNCSDYIKKQSYNIVMSAQNLVKGDLDIDWGTEDEPIDYENLLAILNRNIKLRGTIYLSSLDFEQKLNLMSILKQDNIDTIHPSLGLKVIVKQFVKLDKVSIYPTELYAGIVGNRYTFTCLPGKIQANNVKTTTWTIEEGNAMGQNTVSSLFKVISNTGNFVIERTGNTFNEVEDSAIETLKPSVIVNVKVTCYDSNAKTETYDIESTARVYLYERLAKIGDIVYHDGSISTIEKLDRNKIPVGVCFYSEKLSNEDKLAGKTPLRLMCALDEFNVCNTTVNGKNIPLIKWGIDTNSNIELIDNPDINLADVPGIYNYSTFVPSASITKWQHLRNDDNTDFIKDNSILITGKPGCAYGEFGLREINDLTIFEGLEPEKTTVTSGETMPYGKYNTLAIISLRNKILKDSSFDNYRNVVVVPYLYKDPTSNIEEMHEYQILEMYMKQTVEELYDSNNNIDEIYFACASYCYGYQPYLQSSAKSELDPRFRVHNWWLPSGGEMARLGYYMNANLNQIEENKDFNIFEPLFQQQTADAINTALKESQRFKISLLSPNSNYATSSEGTTIGDAWFVDIKSSDSNLDGLNNQQLDKDYNNNRAVRPICMF